MGDPESATMQKVAVIGAGLSGVVLARHLGSRAEVTVFEKSRGPGGRLSTRRNEGFEFDHGAQFFTARDPRFQLFLQPYLRSGLVQEWKPQLLTLSPNRKPYKRDWFEPHYVAVPGMNSLVKELAREVTVQLAAEIVETGFHDGAWYLRSEDGVVHGPFDWLVSTCPVAQTRKLLPEDFQPETERVKLQGCFALMLGFQQQPKTNWQAAMFKESCLDWAAWNSSKPGRSARAALTVLSDNGWAEEHLDDPLETVRARMLEELSELAGILVRDATVQLHRWRYANAHAPLGESFLLDPERQVAACGDWCLANRVEAAFLSAARLANRLFQLIPHH